MKCGFEGLQRFGDAVAYGESAVCKDGRKPYEEVDFCRLL